MTKSGVLVAPPAKPNSRHQFSAESVDSPEAPSHRRLRIAMENQAPNAPDGRPPQNVQNLQRRAPEKGASASIAEAQEAIATARAAVDDAVALAGGTDATQTNFLAYLGEQLKQLTEQVKVADRDRADAIQDRARELGRYRAYFMSPSQLRADSQAILDELRDWKVPAASLADFAKRLQDDILNADLTLPDKLARARATLEDALETYDYWDDYIDWYLGQTKCASVSLLAAATVSLVGAVLLFGRGHMLFGFLVAGICGASISMLASLPPISVYGEMMGLCTRILYRYGVGVAGTAVGCGMLALGMLNFFPKGFDFLAVMNGSAQAASATNVAVLLAIGILLGFSERAMGSFEDRIFPPDNRGSARPST
jgi:hypothetical protein